MLTRLLNFLTEWFQNVRFGSTAALKSRVQEGPAAPSDGAGCAAIDSPSAEDGPLRAHAASRHGSPRRLFVHVPKTAGTSFRLALEQRFGSDSICYDYGVHSKTTSSLVKHEKKTDLWSFWKAFEASGCVWLAGHVALTQYVGLFGAANSVAFLRDPLQRVLSEFHHFVRNNGYDKNLTEFLAEPRFQNKQARQLGNIPLGILGFVGLSERYEESLRLINRLWEGDLPLLEENVGRPALDAEYDVDETTRLAIAKSNAADQRVYDEAKGLFEQRIQLAEAGKPFTRSGFLSLNNARINGCAVRDDDSPVPIEIQVNGASIAKVSAHVYNQAAHALGVGRGGHVGFNAKLDGLSSGDEITVRAGDTGQMLTVRPLVVDQPSV